VPKWSTRENAARDGQEIAGDFKQGGLTIPLTLKKVAKATESRRPQLPAETVPV